MKVFKFGGASVATAEKVKNIGTLLSTYQEQKLLVVISAMGKTTNALEKVVEAFYDKNKTRALHLFNLVIEDHMKINEELQNGPLQEITDTVIEIEWLLHDKPIKQFDYYYDQIVCAGELLSTAIVSHYLNKINVFNSWVDVRDIIRTDNNFREGGINWTVTKEKVNRLIKPLYHAGSVVLTQGFIGATDENETTTLGREGSDYSAAVFANLLDAEGLTIWKDVEGVMNADPKQYLKAQWIKELNYKEVIEMAYYGAQVIHPKTIKPLQNKDIPLYVRSFNHPDREGTVIHHKSLSHLPSIIVYKTNQVLLHLTTKDFSFVGEGLTKDIYNLFNEMKFEPNLTQHAAISMLCVVDDHPEKIEQFALAASLFSEIQVTKNLTLLTIRHYTLELINELSSKAIRILKQQTPETVQVLVQDGAGQN
ncbi:MAG: aspartate kinase [Flavisolibacter sp.]